jgi:hypothetical protein
MIQYKNAKGKFVYSFYNPEKKKETKADRYIFFTQNLAPKHSFYGYSLVIIYDENNLDSSQFRQMIRGFSKIDQENLKYLNDNVPTKEFIRKLIVEEKGISFIKKDKEKYYEIIIPMQKNYLALFNEQIIRIFNSVAKKVEIEKSITKDWNDDLRKIKSEIYNQTYNQEQKQLNPNNSKGPKI